MQPFRRRSALNVVSIFILVAVCTLAAASSAIADGYGGALKGVKGLKAVFDYSQPSPQMSNIILGAVKGMYEEEAAKALPEGKEIVIVFQGPAVKLITSDRSNFPEKDFAELDKLHAMIRQLKADGVTMEVCLYAANVVGVDPATILPEIDQVNNGFISTIGYQAQGYAMVRVP
jgi:intracellular sulfur oxidation DsrE/DsrF family protein